MVFFHLLFRPSETIIFTFSEILSRTVVINLWSVYKEVSATQLNPRSSQSAVHSLQVPQSCSHPVLQSSSHPVVQSSSHPVIQSSSREVSSLVRCQPAQILSDNIKFEVDDRALFDLVEIGVFESIRNNGNLKGVFQGVNNREAHSVNGN